MSRCDDLILGGWKILQSTHAFRFGTDAVLLYGILPQECGRTVDLCSGNGAVALMTLAGKKAETVTAVELQEEGCRLARESAALNQAEDRLQVVCGNIREIDLLLPARAYDTVSVNPPYFKKNSAILPPEPAIAISRHELECTLEDVFKAGAHLLKDGGGFYMVHRTERYEEICEKIKKYDLYPEMIYRIFTAPKRQSRLFLIVARKAMPQVECKYLSFTVMDAQGNLSKAYRSIYEE